MTLEVVARVDDHGQVAGREYLLQSDRELRSTDASGEADNAHRSSDRRFRSAQA
jgi:hypothetical protein